jgi:hypothetical protein
MGADAKEAGGGRFGAASIVQRDGRLSPNHFAALNGESGAVKTGEIGRFENTGNFRHGICSHGADPTRKRHFELGGPRIEEGISYFVDVWKKTWGDRWEFQSAVYTPLSFCR